MRPQAIFLCLIGLSQSQSDQHQHPILDAEFPQPLIGFGTWNLKISPSNTSDAVSIAIQAGYRQIDCAAAYGNEKDVGRGIADGLKKANLKRNQIWVTSKLWNDYHAPDKVEEGLNQTLKDLGVEYLDLYLIHWPVGKSPDQEKYHYDYVETWRAMIALPKSRVRNIGVSNFSPDQLHKLIKETSVKPAVHQMELHPYLQQSQWIELHKAYGISVTAYSPLGNTNPTYHSSSGKSVSEDPPLLLENGLIRAIAQDHNCTPAQVVLWWGMKRGTSVIPKSSHEEYINENLGSLDCKLNGWDFNAVNGLARKYVRRFNNPSDGWGVHLFEGLDDAYSSESWTTRSANRYT